MREEQWHRRKEKEHAREGEIRREEKEMQNNIRQRYEDDLKAKDNVLRLTQNLLSVSRDREVAAADSNASITERDNGNNNNRKRARVEEGEEKSNNGGEDKKVTIHPPIMEEKEKDHRKTQENLLCLSYAMYDTLFGAEHFNPKSFCDFLIQSGARSVAEEVALAAIEKTNGSAEVVRYVLEHLVPKSRDPETLVGLVKKTLQGNDATTTTATTRSPSPNREEGKQVLIDWQVRHGNAEDAFQSALLIADELMRVKACIKLLEGKDARRQQLRQSCPIICSPKLLNIFKDDEWPDFLASDVLPMHLGYRWEPKWDVIVRYAANSMNSTESGRAVAVKGMYGMFKQFSSTFRRDCGLPGPSGLHNENEASNRIMSLRKESSQDMIKFLTQMETRRELVHEDLALLSINWLYHLSICINKMKIIENPISECTTNHRDLCVVYKCSKCRESIGKNVKAIGFLIGLREHVTTKENPFFWKLGLNGKNAHDALQSAQLHPAGVNAILADLTTGCIESLTAKPSMHGG